MPEGPPVVWQNVWKCEKCGHVVGTGDTKPNLSRCPNCGVRFKNGSGGAGWIGGVVAGVVVVAMILGRVLKR